MLEQLVKGMTNKEIAKELSISNKTVKNHVSSILRKMNTKNRTHAVIKRLEEKEKMREKDEREEVMNAIKTISRITNIEKDDLLDFIGHKIDEMNKC